MTKAKSGFDGEDRKTGESDDFSEMERMVMECLERVAIAQEDRAIQKQQDVELQQEMNDIETSSIASALLNSDDQRRKRKRLTPNSSESFETSLLKSINSMTSGSADDSTIVSKRLELDEQRLKAELYRDNFQVNGSC